MASTAHTAYMLPISLPIIFASSNLTVKQLLDPFFNKTYYGKFLGMRFN
jgi:hypothetical protein